VGAAVWLLLLPRTPRKVMLTQAHPRDGGDCVASLERVYSVPRWAICGRRKMLLGPINGGVPTRYCRSRVRLSVVAVFEGRRGISAMVYESR
jgi:hypothetical protein